MTSLAPFKGVSHGLRIKSAELERGKKSFSFRTIIIVASSANTERRQERKMAGNSVYEYNAFAIEATAK